MSRRRLLVLVLLAVPAFAAACSDLKAADAVDAGIDPPDSASPNDEGGLGPSDGGPGIPPKKRVVQVLASGFSNPHEIVLDQDTVYFTQEFDATSTVRKVKKDGTGSEIVAPHDAASGLNPYAADIVIAGDDVAWVNTTASAGGIFAKRRDGNGAVRRISGYLDAPYRLAFAEGYFYFVDRDFNPDYALGRMLVDGGARTTLVEYQIRVEGLAVDGTSVFWTHSGPIGPSGKNGLRKHRRDLVDAATDLHVGNDNTDLGGIALGAAEVFWADLAGGRILRTSKTGGVRAELAAGLKNPVRVAFDDTYVYFTQYGSEAAGTIDGKVSRVPAAGGAVEDLATGIDHPWGIAVDATHVYWTAYGGGEVARVAK